MKILFSIDHFRHSNHQILLSVFINVWLEHCFLNKNWVKLCARTRWLNSNFDEFSLYSIVVFIVHIIFSQKSETHTIISSHFVIELKCSCFLAKRCCFFLRRISFSFLVLNVRLQGFQWTYGLKSIHHTVFLSHFKMRFYFPIRIVLWNEQRNDSISYTGKAWRLDHKTRIYCRENEKTVRIARTTIKTVILWNRTQQMLYKWAVKW